MQSFHMIAWHNLYILELFNLPKILSEDTPFAVKSAKVAATKLQFRTQNVKWSPKHCLAVQQMFQRL